MKEIREIAGFIRDELESAEDFAWEATKHKAELPELASVYQRMATAKMEHAEVLYKHGTALLEEMKRRNDPETHKCTAVWEFAHEGMLKEMADVKHMLDVYKN